MMWWAAIGIGILVGLLIVYSIYDRYQERQWRKRNPDEWIYQEGLRRGMYKEPKPPKRNLME